MDEQDRLYRLTRDVRTALNECPQATAMLAALTDAEGGGAYRGQLTQCRFRRDWIDAIEEGLPYVERAVEEQRRFIRTRREVVRIDQAKSVSPESVRHLAQHSNFISHVDDNGDVIPEKLLIVEREENFAIYENRFLFTLVTVMCDFVERRSRMCTQTDGTLVFEMNASRGVQADRRQINAAVRFNEEIRPDPKRASDALYDELGRLRERVNALAATQLMQMLRGTPMVASPVIHTNVIKKNANFQKALELYEFLQNYGETGCERIAVAQDYDADAWQGALEDVLALTVVQESVVSGFADGDGAAALERRYQAENERRETERLRLEREREEAVLARIEAARRGEIAVREAEIAKREDTITAKTNEIAGLHEEAARQEKAFEAFRITAEAREQALRMALQQTTERLNAEIADVRATLATETERLQASQAARESEQKQAVQALQAERASASAALAKAQTEHEAQIAALTERPAQALQASQAAREAEQKQAEQALQAERASASAVLAKAQTEREAQIAALTERAAKSVAEECARSERKQRAAEQAEKEHLRALRKEYERQLREEKREAARVLREQKKQTDERVAAKDKEWREKYDALRRESANGAKA